MKRLERRLWQMVALGCALVLASRWMREAEDD